MCWNVAREQCNVTHHSWNKQRVKELYGVDLGNRICNLLIVREDMDDRIIWFHSPSGAYSTKSGYSWLILRKVGYRPHRLFWRLVWKL